MLVEFSEVAFGDRYSSVRNLPKRRHVPKTTVQSSIYAHAAAHEASMAFASEDLLERWLVSYYHCDLEGKIQK